MVQSGIRANHFASRLRSFGKRRHQEVRRAHAPIDGYPLSRFLRRSGVATAAIIIALSGWAGARAETAVDLELVFAVDASGSVDAEEYALQLGGIAAAFRDRAVTDAIASGLHRRIAVAMVIWADASAPKDTTDWWIIGSAADAHAFAAFVESRPRRIRGGATGIGSGIAAAIRLIDGNSILGRRSVVDVSGDGIENSSQEIAGNFRNKVADARAIDEARAIAEARGITVNGLAIVHEVPDLADWYAREVRIGPGSFVMTADGYDDFARAMRAKVLREIGTAPAVTDLGGGRRAERRAVRFSALDRAGVIRKARPTGETGASRASTSQTRIPIVSLRNIGRVRPHGRQEG